ncbi:MAG: hypothetical protein AAB434_01465 [Planctomycetota bacterium]
MKLATWTALLLSLALRLPAQGAKCATCTGKGEASCFACSGKGTIDAPCAICLTRADATCFACAGKGGVACRKCEGADLAGHRADAQNCHACHGKRTLTCRVCVKGKVSCGACKGTSKASRCCPICVGKKKLPCPDCTTAPAAADCAMCKGAKTESCPICQGAKQVPVACTACLGSSVNPCSACQGLGLVLCPSCDLNGHEDTRICEKCNGKSFKACVTCRGKGTQACASCSVQGPQRQCWACLAVGTISCRRCVEGVKLWSAKDEASGARVTVLPIAPFEPHLIAAVREAYPTSQPVLWRIVIDARESKPKFELGGANGWQLNGKEPTEQVVVVGEGRFPKELEEQYGGILAMCGLLKEGGKYPLTVAPTRVGTTLLWEMGDPDAAMTGFFLRPGAGSKASESLTLVEAPATWFDWVRLMTAATKLRK